ncbi:MAG: type III-A CRISPR-associated RAMP protein Csm4 [Clostridiales bacterium]|nr:type III-A CRISPR-associated RAMP protein Csm4 [Clostridiales bacterium]
MTNIETLIYKLEFPKGVHLGDRKLSDANMTLRADTIFSALCHQAIEQDSHGIEHLLELINQGLRLSDAFPYYQEELFLPKPMLAFHKEDADSSQKKLFKSINYIALSDWDSFLKGDGVPEKLKEAVSRLDHTTVYTKIMHDPTGAHDIYNIGVRYFPKEAGLYFILQCPSEAVDQMDELLYALSFSGIGGKRKVGFGRFELLEAEGPACDLLKKYLEGEWPAYMSLSIGLPQPKEGASIEDALGYQVIRRGGFIASPAVDQTGARRKRDLFMIKSGSVFKTTFSGDVYDVSDGYAHPVYQYGMPIFLGVNI